MTKHGRSGKLAEPTTLQMAKELLEASKISLGYQGVYIGVEKIDNNGNMKYTSTGLKTPISPWKESGSGVNQGITEPYVCFYVQNSGAALWQDCNTHSLVSLCEF